MLKIMQEARIAPMARVRDRCARHEHASYGRRAAQTILHVGIPVIGGTIQDIINPKLSLCKRACWALIAFRTRQMSLAL